MSDTPEQNELTPKPKKRLALRHAGHLGRAVLTGLGGFAVALILGFILLVGRDLRAPDWLQARIEEKIAQALPDVDIALGSMSLRIERADLSPRVFFQNVTIQDETGLPFASLGELSIRAAFPAAIRGQFLPKKVSLSGALMKLRRRADGRIDLTIGSALQASGEGASLVSLIEGLDDVLVLPELRYLREVNANSLTVLYEDARAGRAWTVDGGRLRLSAKNEQLVIGADFALLGGQDYATTLELSYESPIGAPSAKIGVALADAPAQDIATQSQALAWMEALRAPISGSLRTTVDDAGDLGPLNATLQIGTGMVQPEDEARPIPFDGAQAYFTFDPKQSTLEFSEISVKSAWIEAKGEGLARLQSDPNGWSESLLGQFRLSALKANPNELYPEPVTLEQADIDMRLTFDPFKIEIGQLVLREAGQTLIAEGSADVDPDGWRVAIDARAEELDIERVLEVWPDTIKPKTRTWIETNIIKGSIQQARLAFRALAAQKPELHLNFDYSDASLRFMKTLPPIEGANGYVRIEGSRFLAASETGRVRALQGGDIDVAGTVFEIPNMRIKQAPAKVHLKTQSTITAALSLLDEKPFEFISKAGQSVTLADGQAQLKGDIDFVLKRKLPASEIGFDIAGEISGVRSESLVEGRTLAAQSLKVAVKSDEIMLKGAGRIDAVPFDGTWRMPSGQTGAGSQITGKIELSERFVDTFNIGLPPGSISGKGQADLTIDLKPQSAPSFALTSDLQGVDMRIAQLGYRKAASSKGSLSVRGSLGSKKTGPPSVKSLSYDAPGLKVNGSVQINANGTLDQARFERVQAGDWLDGEITLSGRGKGKAPALDVSRGFMDLRNLPAQNGSGQAQTIPISVSLDRLQVTKDITLRNFNGKFVSNRGLDGTFSARLNNQAPVTGRTVPKAGRIAVQIKSDRAGEVLSAAGLLKNAAEGTLTLNLEPIGGAGEYDGELAIQNIRLRDAPPSLSLLSAASGIGLLEQLGGRGLYFSDVSSRFRISPSVITISQASAVGPSLGLSVDGFYGVQSKKIDMQGVVSPFFAINGIGSILTRRGEGLIGFNYTAVGDASAPTVNVNPLSLFTPGMFREIFRRPPPKLSQ